MTLNNTPDPISMRPTILDIDLDVLLENYEKIRRRVAPAKVMAVLKANAYGHGLIACARHLEQAGADAFGVALLEEGIALRRAGIQTPILVFGGIVGGQIKHFLDYNLDLTASSISKLEAIEAEAKARGKRARAHLKIDTGMERIGVHHYSAAGLFRRAQSCEHCDVVGIFSHFATAAESDLSFAAEQLHRFNTVCQQWTLPGMPVRHIANSGAILQLPGSYLDMVRAGICLYGVYPERPLAGRLELRPVMSLKSEVVYFKVVKAGSGISYGHTWRAETDTRVVTIPIGYGDGYPRALSNTGRVLIRGLSYPIVGRVCMDQIMVNIGLGEAYNGDEVVLIGQQGPSSITVEELAERAGMIPYELLTALNLRVPRRYHRGSDSFME